MRGIAIDGKKLTFYVPGQPDPELTIDFSKSFRWVKRVGDDVVLALNPGDVTFIEKREPDATIRWTVLQWSDDDQIEVTPDDLSMRVNEACIALPGKLRAADVRPESIMVVVYPNEGTGDRNVYRYNRDGTLQWQIGERTFLRGRPFTSVDVRADGTAKAEGGPDGLGAIVDYDTGKVLRQEDIR